MLILPILTVKKKKVLNLNSFIFTRIIGGEVSAVNLQKLLKRKYEISGFNQVYGWVLKSNPQSNGFYRKLGAKPDGIERISERTQEEDNVREVRYSLTLGNPNRES